MKAKHNLRIAFDAWLARNRYVVAAPVYAALLRSREVPLAVLKNAPLPQLENEIHRVLFGTAARVSMAAAARELERIGRAA